MANTAYLSHIVVSHVKHRADYLLSNMFLMVLTHSAIYHVMDMMLPGVPTVPGLDDQSHDYGLSPDHYPALVYADSWVTTLTTVFWLCLPLIGTHDPIMATTVSSITVLTVTQAILIGLIIQKLSQRCAISVIYWIRKLACTRALKANPSDITQTRAWVYSMYQQRLLA